MLPATVVTWLERCGGAVSLARLIKPEPNPRRIPKSRERVCNVANIKSQKKRILTNAKATERNKSIRSLVKTSVKKVQEAITAGDKAAATAAAQQLGLEIHPGWQTIEIVNEIFSKKIEPNLIQPTFVTHLPKELCPLAKLTLDDPTTIDVFELCIGGMEVAPAYSEQNDPDVQRAMFEAQAGEEKQNIDQDFLLALEHGMPPAGGMGVGIDRLCILLTGAESIRDVILFPQLRPGA